MLMKTLVKGKTGRLVDWVGNNIALSCPACGKVYVVSGIANHGNRDCPECGKSRGFVNANGTKARIECDEELWDRV